MMLLACGGSGATIGSIDSGADTLGAVETGASDTGKPKKDASVGNDGGTKDTGAKDTGTVETSAPETGTAETGAPDTGLPETGAKETGPAETGAQDTGVDTGSRDTGTVADGPPVCGDGILQTGEQCDDGNLFDLDGCDSSCHYELVTRLTAFTISGDKAPDAMGCVPNVNAIGTKVVGSMLVLSELNNPVQTDITSGDLNIFTDILGMSGDLTGLKNATGITIGVLDGNLDPARGTWPTSGNPIDWWFLADHAAISAGLPTATLTGGVDTAGVLTAGPGTVSFPFFGGNVQMLGAKIAATIGAADDVPAPPPTKLAPGLTVLETMTTTANQGLCGNVTVASLANIPVPSLLTSGTEACNEGYVYCGAGNPVGASCNSLLDVFIGGCTITIGGLLPITAVNPTQPDVPPPGVTAISKLVVGAGKKVTVPANLSQEAYSLYTTFSANRAHFTSETCAASTDCQTGQTCTGNVCQD